MYKNQTEMVSPDVLVYDVYLVNYFEQSSRIFFDFFTHSDSGEEPVLYVPRNRISL